MLILNVVSVSISVCIFCSKVIYGLGEIIRKCKSYGLTKVRINRFIYLSEEFDSNGITVVRLTYGFIIPYLIYSYINGCRSGSRSCGVFPSICYGSSAVSCFIT